MSLEFVGKTCADIRVVSESANKTATILSCFKGGLKAEFAIDRAKIDRDLSFGMLFVLFKIV